MLIIIIEEWNSNVISMFAIYLGGIGTGNAVLSLEYSLYFAFSAKISGWTQKTQTQSYKICNMQAKRLLCPKLRRSTHTRTGSEQNDRIDPIKKGRRDVFKAMVRETGCEMDPESRLNRQTHLLSLYGCNMIPQSPLQSLSQRSILRVLMGTFS